MATREARVLPGMDTGALNSMAVGTGRGDPSGEPPLPCLLLHKFVEEREKSKPGEAGVLFNRIFIEFFVVFIHFVVDHYTGLRSSFALCFRHVVNIVQMYQELKTKPGRKKKDRHGQAAVPAF
jgi:hypothetical protein